MSAGKQFAAHRTGRAMEGKHMTVAGARDTGQRRAVVALRDSVYSLRNACMGSTWVARSAGRHIAEKETTSRMNAAMPYTEGSKASICIHESLVRRIQAQAAGMAIASPRRKARPIWRRPFFITERNIDWRVAPTVI